MTYQPSGSPDDVLGIGERLACGDRVVLVGEIMEATTAEALEETRESHGH